MTTRKEFILGAGAVVAAAVAGQPLCGSPPEVTYTMIVGDWKG